MTFITTSSIYFIIPILGPFLLNENEFISQKYRHIYYCMTLTFPQVFMVLGPPLWGALSDQFGRKMMLVCALAGVAMSVLISAIGIKFHWAWCLLLGQAFLGITDASDCLAQAAVIDLSDCINKSRNMNLVNFCGTLGLVAGPLFGGIFSDQRICSAFHYETPFIIALFLLILNALGFLFVIVLR
jgi:MFS transporter, DHA1 family, tetracycline resistance protein